MRHEFTFLEPRRMIQNKIWATKGIKRPYMSVKKVMYIIYFTNQGPANQIAVTKKVNHL